MGLIPEETIQQIIAATDIVDLIGSYFPVKRAGSNFRALCPFHQEKTPSFNISPARQSYHCFGCKAGGGAIRFVMDYENLDFPAAVRKLADRAGILVHEEETDPGAEQLGKRKRRLLTLQQEVAAWFHHLLFKDRIADAARAYLKKRGIAMETAREWQLGYAPESSEPIRQWAREKGFSDDLLVEGGLLSHRDEQDPALGTYCRFRHRLMFPIANDYGEVIAFSGRLLNPDAKAAKYVNSPETILFSKGKIFYGLDKTRQDILREGCAIVCEGQLDLIACFSSGIRHVIAPLGTAFTEQHARILKRYTEEAILCFDSDEAGFKAAERTFAEMAKVNLMARVAEMPPGEDPDSFIKSRGAAAFLELIEGAREFLDFQIECKGKSLNLDSLRDRMRFAHELAGNVALIGEKILQDSAIHQVSARLGIPAEDFRRTVIARHREQQRQRKGAEGTRHGGAGAEAAVAGPLVIGNRAVTLLCQVLLTSAEAREHFCKNNQAPEFLKDIRETDVLSKVWSASIRVDHPANVAAFLASLDPREEGFLSGLIHDAIPGTGLETARDCVLALKRQGIENRLQEKISFLKRSDLSVADITKLQKEVLDLKMRLTDISPFVQQGGS